MAKWPDGLIPPTPWQQRMMWAALTGLSLFAIAWLAIYSIRVLGALLGYLQPLLIPVAVAAILAYLLDPVVEKLVSLRVPRTRAVFCVFVIVFVPLAMILFWVIPQIYRQSLDFGAQIPDMVEKARRHALELAHKYERYTDNPYIQQVIQQGQDWAQQQLPTVPDKVWKFVIGSIEGFLGGFSFLLSLVVIPIYLFFFLRDAATISTRWSDYLPLRSSAFKDEVVACLTEINSYLIAFFRGQVLVTSIDGVLLGAALLMVGLPFALLIGLLIAVLQLIPYLGIVLCWIPAVLIALAHWGDWQHPLIVTLIFLAMSNIDGFIIAPRIIGESVGLHPVTVIVSVFAWSLLIGGLLGALMAVPLTATLKVLLKRYVWERCIVHRAIATPGTAQQPSAAVIEVPPTATT